jgi:hypothetical protein
MVSDAERTFHVKRRQSEPEAQATDIDRLVSRETHENPPFAWSAYLQRDGVLYPKKWARDRDWGSIQRSALSGQQDGKRWLESAIRGWRQFEG